MIKFQYKHIAAVALLTASLSSCNKLDEFNPGAATAEETWTTPQGFITAVNAAYYQQRYWYGKEDGLFLSESGTDLWFNDGYASYSNQLARYLSFTANNNNHLKNTWPTLWKGINQCNAGIGRIDKAGFKTEAEKNQRLAELRFLRAFYYYHVVEQFGGVMLRTQETTEAEITATRSPVEDFYKLIVDDLLYAKDNLPNDWGAEYSRATKKSALGLLARAYLARGYYSTGADANAWFTKARDAAQEVINRKTEFGVDLWSSYADIFKPANNKKNKEALYIISNSAKNTATSYDINANRLHKFYLFEYTGKPGLQRSIDYGMDNERRLMPTRAYLDLFDDAKDSRYDASFQEVWFGNLTAPFVWTTGNIGTYNRAGSVVGQSIIPGDTAMYITRKSIPNRLSTKYVCYDRDSLFNVNGTFNPRNNKYHPVLKKFYDNTTRTTPDQTAGYLDIMVIRLAEMYMIAAEAEFKLGNLAAAATQINVLRTRAAKSGQAAAFQVTAADITTDFILDERAREFGGELMRWFDLKRMLTGPQFVARIKTKNPDITEVQEYHRLRPVPQPELDALSNRTEFGQNPGYQ